MSPRPSSIVRPVLAVLVAVLASLAAGSAWSPADAAQESGDVTVEILPLDGFVDPPVAGAIADLVTQANERGSDLVVVQLDTPGAVSADVDELVATIRESSVPVVLFVGPRGTGARAAGAGTVLATASHVLAMADDATLGPAAPVDLGDEADPQATSAVLRDLLGADVGDETLRALAGEGRGDDGLTPDQVRDGGIDVVGANGLEPLLVELDGYTVETADGTRTLRIRSDEVTTRLHSLGLVRRALHAATTPVFIYLLFTVGLALLLFEVFQPGFGVAGLAGLVTAAIGVFGLTVLPVHWWAVGLLVLGLVLYAVDVAIAGFGVVTAAATAAFVAGSWWLYDSPHIGLSGWLVGAMAISALVFFVGVMTMVLRAQAGPDEAAVTDLVGKVGMVRSMLNPEGHVYIDGALWRARWIGEGKRAKVGTPVRVDAVEGPLVLVDRFEAPATTSTAGGQRDADA